MPLRRAVVAELTIPVFERRTDSVPQRAFAVSPARSALETVITRAGSAGIVDPGASAELLAPHPAMALLATLFLELASEPPLARLRDRRRSFAGRNRDRRAGGF